MCFSNYFFFSKCGESHPTLPYYKQKDTSVMPASLRTRTGLNRLKQSCPVVAIGVPDFIQILARRKPILKEKFILHLSDSQQAKNEYEY
jgi:hypothetical protein